MLYGPKQTMSKHQDPIVKKALALERDHRTAMEAPHPFRKGWPKKKASVNRRYRRAVAGQLASISDAGDSISVEPRRRSLRKSGVSTLKERLASNHRHRVEGGPRYMLEPYSAESAADFLRFLNATIKGRTGGSRDQAAWLLRLLDDPLLVRTSTLDYQQRWLRRFLEDHGDQAPRIRAWAVGLG